MAKQNKTTKSPTGKVTDNDEDDDLEVDSKLKSKFSDDDEDDLDLPLDDLDGLHDLGYDDDDDF